MAETIEEFDEELQRVIKSLVEMYRTGNESAESLELLKKFTDKTTTSMEDVGKATLNVVDGMVGFGAAVAGGNTSMSSMKSIVSGTSDALGGLMSSIPIFGNALSAVTKATSKVVNFVIDRMQANYDSFQKISESGLIGAEGMAGLTKQFGEAKIPLATFTGMLMQNSKDLAFLSGSAVKGGKDFATVMAQMENGSNMQLANLGFSIESIGDTVVDFQKMNKQLGITQIMTTDELTKSSIKYGAELDMIAKLTGKSRKEIQAEREALMADDQFRAFIDGQTDMSEKQKSAMMDSINSLPKELQQGAKEYLAAGGAFTEKSIELAVQGWAPALDKLRSGIMDGSADALDARRAFSKVAADNLDMFRELTALGKRAPGPAYAAMADLAKLATMTEEAQVIFLANIDKQMNAPDPTTKAMIEAMNLLRRSNVNIDVMATDVEMVAKAAKVFAETLETTTGFIKRLVLGETKIPGAETAGKFIDKLGTAADYAGDKLTKFADMFPTSAGREPVRKAENTPESERARNAGVELGTEKDRITGKTVDTFSKEEFEKDQAAIIDKRKEMTELFVKNKNGMVELSEVDKKRLITLTQESEILDKKLRYIRELQKTPGSFKLLDNKTIEMNKKNVNKPLTKVESKQREITDYRRNNVRSSGTERNRIAMNKLKKELTELKESEVANKQELSKRVVPNKKSYALRNENKDIERRIVAPRDKPTLVAPRDKPTLVAPNELSKNKQTIRDTEFKAMKEQELAKPVIVENNKEVVKVLVEVKTELKKIREEAANSAMDGKALGIKTLQATGDLGRKMEDNTTAVKMTGQ